MICDLAETYHIFDYRALPLKTVATLVFGLGDNSRVKMKISNQKATIETILLAAIADRLSWLVYANSEDARRNRNKPASILEAITKQEQTEKVKVFQSGEDFDEAFKKLTGGE